MSSLTMIFIYYFGGSGVYVVTEARRRYNCARSCEVHAQFVRRADLRVTPDPLEKRRGRPRPLAAAAYPVMIRSLWGQGRHVRRQGSRVTSSQGPPTTRRATTLSLYIKEAESCEAGGAVRPSIPSQWDGDLFRGRGGGAQVGVSFEPVCPKC